MARALRSTHPRQRPPLLSLHRGHLSRGAALSFCPTTSLSRRRGTRAAGCPAYPDFVAGLLFCLYASPRQPPDLRGREHDAPLASALAGTPRLNGSRRTNRIVAPPNRIAALAPTLDDFNGISLRGRVAYARGDDLDFLDHHCHRH